ncbi:unnamed protein product, partial [Closterium sp. NIES-65]
MLRRLKTRSLPPALLPSLPVPFSPSHTLPRRLRPPRLFPILPPRTLLVRPLPPSRPPPVLSFPSHIVPIPRHPLPLHPALPPPPLPSPLPPVFRLPLFPLPRVLPPPSKLSHLLIFPLPQSPPWRLLHLSPIPLAQQAEDAEPIRNGESLMDPPCLHRISRPSHGAAHSSGGATRPSLTGSRPASAPIRTDRPEAQPTARMPPANHGDERKETRHVASAGHHPHPTRSRSYVSSPAELEDAVPPLDAPRDAERRRSFDGSESERASLMRDAWLPARLMAAVQRSDTLVVIALRESIVFLALIALFAVTPNVCRALNWLWASFIMRDGQVTEECFQDSVFGALVLPLQFVAAAFFLTRHMRLLLPLAKLHLSPFLLRRFRMVSVVVAVTCFAVGWKDRVMRMVLQRHPAEKPILLNASRFLSLLIHLVGVGTVLDLFGVSLLSLVAVGGISGVAMGFASKEIVANFFGGLVLVISQPFVVGERIQAGAISGRVEEIGFLHTKLAGANKAPVVVPNQIFNTAVITNFSRARCYPVAVTFELRIEDIERVQAITSRITRMLRSHADVDQSQGPAHAVLKDLNGASLHVGMLASLNPQVRFQVIPGNSAQPPATTGAHQFPAATIPQYTPSPVSPYRQCHSAPIRGASPYHFSAVVPVSPSPPPAQFPGSRATPPPASSFPPSPSANPNNGSAASPSASPSLRANAFYDSAYHASASTTTSSAEPLPPAIISAVSSANQSAGSSAGSSASQSAGSSAGSSASQSAGSSAGSSASQSAGSSAGSSASQSAGSSAGSSRGGNSSASPSAVPVLREFSFADLHMATGGFSRAIGEGGFGKVYQGRMVLPAGTSSGIGGSSAAGGSYAMGGSSRAVMGAMRECDVAVKVMNGKSATRDLTSFKAEVEAMSAVNHPNILRLEGVALNTSQGPMLVYELIPGGDVKNLLKQVHRSGLYFPWRHRMKVALGCAEALAAIHEHKFVHRDFKSSNVLLRE